MRNSFSATLFLLTTLVLTLGVSGKLVPVLRQSSAPAGPQTPPAAGQSPATGQPLQSSTSLAPAGTPKPALPVTSGFVVVLDPAHGGTDTGARGAGGIVEKDVTLQLARTVRADLERQGIRVVMTRNDDSNPSYDDRAADANGHRDAIFISLHVSSTGIPGTARAYYYQFWTPLTAQAPSSPAAGDFITAPIPLPQTPRSDLIVWREAQRSYGDLSRRLADGLQLQLDQVFMGSPPASASASVRDLRSVSIAAVAVGLSSVSVSQPDQLNRMAEPLAASVGKAVAAYRTGSTTGAK